MIDAARLIPRQQRQITLKLRLPAPGAIARGCQITVVICSLRRGIRAMRSIRFFAQVAFTARGLPLIAVTSFVKVLFVCEVHCGTQPSAQPSIDQVLLLAAAFFICRPIATDVITKPIGTFTVAAEITQSSFCATPGIRSKCMVIPGRKEDIQLFAPGSTE